MNIKSKWLAAILSIGCVKYTPCPCCILKKATPAKVVNKKKEKEDSEDQI